MGSKKRSDTAMRGRKREKVNREFVDHNSSVGRPLRVTRENAFRHAPMPNLEWRAFGACAPARSLRMKGYGVMQISRKIAVNKKNKKKRWWGTSHSSELFFNSGSWESSAKLPVWSRRFGP